MIEKMEAYLMKVFFGVLCFCFLGSSYPEVTADREFKIDYEHNTFVKDGTPFRYVSGSIHYARIHPDYWQDRLRKIRAAGLNAIQGYVPWNIHESVQGNFSWEGFADLPRFLSLAQQEDLVVLLRLGPYMCGEWTFGGFPGWLLSQKPEIVFRTSDPGYLKFVDRWFTELLNKIKPYLYKNGGPIVMVQIENEYGSTYMCDKAYMLFLRDKCTSILGSDVVMYTTDGDADHFLQCGKTEGVYATVDFGPGSNITAAFQAQRDYEKSGPLVNSEFYSGTFNHWGHEHGNHNIAQFTKDLDAQLSFTNFTSVNMYMFIGGTSFEYNNGANESPHVYSPQITSYDYSAPLTEAGDVTPFYMAIKDVVAKYLPPPSIPIPANTTKTDYGNLKMEFICSIFDALSVLTPEGPTRSIYTVPMEAVDFYGGFILYRHTVSKAYPNATLSVPEIRDRAIVMVNGVPFGILDRVTSVFTLVIEAVENDVLDILVENQGRTNYGFYVNFNNKGIVGNVTLDGEILSDWLLYPLHTENIKGSFKESIQKLRSSIDFQPPKKSRDGKLVTPCIFGATFNDTDMQDTFLNPKAFQKGQAFINDFNIGRYWPLRGPQVTLYVPKQIFHAPPSSNAVHLFELEYSTCFDNATSCYVRLLDKPNLFGAIHPDP